MPKRIVVTGVGVVSPLGNTAPTTWSALLEGKSGIEAITAFDTTGSPVKIAGEVKNFESPVTKRDQKKMGRFAHFAAAAALEAVAHAKLSSEQTKPFGVHFGVGMGGLPEIQSAHTDFIKGGYKRLTPFFITQTIPNLASGIVSILLGLKGPNLCSATACASSAHAIGESLLMLQNGVCEGMIVGGAEATICSLAIGGFASMRALSTQNEHPHLACRPFDQNRDGFVMGEGAAALVLETLEHAQKRNAPILAELVGYGRTGDAHHITAPLPDGEGGGIAMDLAAQSAGISLRSIDYVNAHATSTPLGDLSESVAISKRVDRTRARVSSTKSMTGHLLGGSGAIEAVFSVLAIRDQVLPPNPTLQNLDPACAATELNYCGPRAEKARIDTVLTNSFGFGGTNASLIFKRYENDA